VRGAWVALRGRGWRTGRQRRRGAGRRCGRGTRAPGRRRGKGGTRRRRRRRGAPRRPLRCSGPRPSRASRSGFFSREGFRAGTQGQKKCGVLTVTKEGGIGVVRGLRGMEKERHSLGRRFSPLRRADPEGRGHGAHGGLGDPVRVPGHGADGLLCDPVRHLRRRGGGAVRGINMRSKSTSAHSAREMRRYGDHEVCSPSPTFGSPIPGMLGVRGRTCRLASLLHLM